LFLSGKKIGDGRGGRCIRPSREIRIYAGVWCSGNWGSGKGLHYWRGVSYCGIRLENTAVNSVQEPVGCESCLQLNNSFCVAAELRAPRDTKSVLSFSPANSLKWVRYRGAFPEARQEPYSHQWTADEAFLDVQQQIYSNLTFALSLCWGLGRHRLRFDLLLLCINMGRYRAFPGHSPFRLHSHTQSSTSERVNVFQ